MTQVKPSNVKKNTKKYEKHEEIKVNSNIAI